MSWRAGQVFSDLAVSLVGNPQCLRMELIERIDQLPQLGRLGLGAQLERLDGTPHHLSGGNAKRSRLGSLPRKATPCSLESHDSNIRHSQKAPRASAVIR